MRSPDTVQGVLAARMDRLSEDLKQTMQVASVIGRILRFAPQEYYGVRRGTAGSP